MKPILAMTLAAMMLSACGVTWSPQPTITSTPLFAVACHGGSDTWVAGRGGAIRRRLTSLATVRIPTPKLGGGPPKLKGAENVQRIDPEDDIPRAVPREKKPQKP